MSADLRTSFRFNHQEAALACRLRDPSSQESAAVRELTGIENLKHASAVQIIHTLIEAGMKIISDKVEEAQRAQLAEFLKEDPEHQAWRDSRRRRAARRVRDVA